MGGLFKTELEKARIIRRAGAAWAVRTVKMQTIGRMPPHGFVGSFSDRAAD
jgi:hypothetical protein